MEESNRLNNFQNALRESLSIYSKERQLILPPELLFLSKILSTTAISSGAIGCFMGYRMGSLQYRAQFTSSSPDLKPVDNLLKPMDKNYWFKYHRNKQYTSMLHGIRYGTKFALKTTSLLASLLFIDTGLDMLQNRVHWSHGLISGSIVGLGFGIINKFNKRLLVQSSFIGCLMGLGMNLIPRIDHYFRGLPFDYQHKYQFPE